MVTTLKYRLAEYELDPSTYSLSRASSPVPVSRKRFEVLLYLVKERHRVVPRHELVERFWDGHEVYEENLTKCISELRKALDDQHKPHHCIETIPAVGYRYIGGVEEQLPPSESLSAEREGTALGAPEMAQKSSADPAVIEAENLLVGSRSQMTSTVRSRPTVFVSTLLVAIIAVVAVAVFVYRFKSSSDTPTIHSLAILPFKPISEQNRDEFLEL